MVTVWLARTNVPAAALARMSDVLDDDERSRAARFRFDDDRARSIVARAALRHILGEALGRDPRALRFVAGEHGKPALAGGEIEFNVSHSGERVAIAVADETTAVGIDIERERAMRDVLAVAGRFFSPNEAAAVERDPSLFFSIWTAKEAVIKAIGGGLTINLASFEAFAATAQFTPVTNLGDYSVIALPVDGGYRCALSIRGQTSTMEMRDWWP
jgi:4'-phosphopantetheinyl transferase